MTHLAVVCEGQTEMYFVQQVLSPHLSTFGVTCKPNLVGMKINRDKPSSFGGVINYEVLYRNITSAIRQHESHHAFVTTMVDFYAFPLDDRAKKVLMGAVNGIEKVTRLEALVFDDLGRPNNFIPYIQLHEFEALIFSKPDELLSQFPDDPKAQKRIESLVKSVHGLGPEEINESPEGAPSKRLIKSQVYSKTRMGPTVTRQIGIANLKAACPHFASWVDRLELLPGRASV